MNNNNIAIMVSKFLIMLHFEEMIIYFNLFLNNNYNMTFNLYNIIFFYLFLKII
jgi:hypothetical protein